MKTLRLPLFLAMSALLLAPLLRASADAPAPASDGKLYVVIETFDPIKFEDLRHSRGSSGELVLSTLKETAVASAKFAGLNDEVVVLDEDVEAPKGAAVLRLTWTDGGRAVTADLTENGRNHSLGVVSRMDTLMHPDRMRLMRTLQSAGTQQDYRDATIRTETEMNLYFGLKMTGERRARLAAKS